MKRRISARLILILLFLKGIGLSASELPPYRIDTWQVDDGLPQSSVLAIVQTQDGYLWFGTAGGLVRFDGVQFKVFTPSSAPGLPSNRILSLFEDHFGALWIGTIEGHLVRYFDGRFRVGSPPEWLKVSSYIQNFAETPDENLWLVSPQKELVRCRQTATNAANFSHGAQQVLQGGVNFLAEDALGQVWSASDSELGAWSGGKFTHVLNLTASGEFSPVVLAGSRGDGCWVAMNGRLQKFTTNGIVVDYGIYPWTKGNVVRMVEDQRGQLWVGTYGSGVYCYATNGVARRFSTEEGLPGNFIRSLCEDREGDLWVGTDGAGLARIKPVVFRSYGREQGLSGDCVMSICQGAGNEMWIGLIADGLDRLQDGVITHFGAAQGLPNDYIHSVFLDRKNQLWVGTWGGGLCRQVGERFVPFANPGECSGIVCALYEDSKNNLWVGQQKARPEIVRIRDGRPLVLRLEGGLTSMDVRAMVEDQSGFMWIGTQGSGLYRIKDGQQNHFGRRDGLGSDDIRSLHLDHEGVLWIGTFGGGLSRFEDGRLITFTTKDGLVNDSLGSVLEDGQDNLWCGSLAGVFRVGKTELNQFASGRSRRIQCLAFTKSDGLPSMECNGGTQPSACKTRDGRLWFPTVQGLAVVDPANIPVNHLPPPVDIDELVVEGKEQKTMPDLAGFAGLAGAGNPLKIGPDIQRLEFHYTGLCLSEPKKVRFKYRLQGLEEDWVEAGTRRTAYYSHLLPGHYRFQVLACNNDGVWNEQGAALALVILPHFWQTWWFKLLGIALVVLLLVAIYEIRLASERKLARIRLRIASDLHDEVGSNLGSIALLSEMIPGVSEEADEIRRVSLQTVSSLREIVWFLDPASDNLHDLVLRMKDTARTMLPGIPFEFLVAGETDDRRPSLHLRRNVLPMFKEILHNIAKHARATRVEIRIQITARRMELDISDNGIGFDQSLARRGNGLKNLRRRTKDLGGQLQVHSQPGGGTRFQLTAPIT